MSALAGYRKAILAGIVGALSFAVPVVDNGVTASEVLGIILAGLVGAGVVYQVPNRPTEPRQ